MSLGESEGREYTTEQSIGEIVSPAVEWVLW